MSSRVSPAPPSSSSSGSTMGSTAAIAAGVGQEAGGKEDKERVKWGGQLEFILTLVGYAVGLGNIWRFPYLCFKNGGGAFLIPYFGTLFLVGLPLFYMELSFGQFASLGPIKIWTINPLMKGLGVATVLTNTFIGVYYNVIISWILYFLFSSMTSELPWATCDHSWNTDYCVPTADMKYINYTGNASDTTERNNRTMLKTELLSPSHEFYYNKVLKLSGGIDEAGTVVWELALTLLLAWMIVFFVLIKGISSLGKVVYFTTLFPYILLTVMVIRGTTLEGAYDGIIYYLKPNWDRLTDARVWSDAVTQIFFSLSVCTGGLIAMASYNKFNNNCYRDAVLVPIINCATSFYGGFATFSVLGYMALQKGTSVEDVAASGPGLVFVVYPEALATMPVAPLWSILFFLMMLTLGLSSMFSIVECFFCSIIDEFEVLNRTRWHNIGFRTLCCLIFYLIGLSMVTEGGFYVFNLLDSYISGFPLLIIGLFECCVIVYIYGWSRFSEDVFMMLGKKPTIYFRVCLCLISPIVLLAVIIFMAVQYTSPTLFSDSYHYPTWAEGVGFMFVIITVGAIPLWWIICIFFQNDFRKIGLWKTIRNNSVPTKDWGPALAEHRTGRYSILSEKDNAAVLSVQEYEKKTGLDNAAFVIGTDSVV